MGTQALKYQSVTIPSGMTANFFGSLEGKRHECAKLVMSGLLQTLERFSHYPNWEVLCAFRDLAYPLRRNLLPPCNGAQLAQQIDFNSSMRKVRATVESMFGGVINNFKFTDFLEKPENWSFLYW